MGSGDEDLGLLLVANYLKLINEETELPRFIVLYNTGVKLICAGSPAMESFKNLEQKGVKIIACKTCLNYFGLMDKMEVGMVGTMMEIVELQRISEKVISI